MSLIKRKVKTKPEVQEPEEELVEASVEDLLGMLREKIHGTVKEGLQTHEAAQVRLDIVALLDELDLKLRPAKKE